MFEQKLHSIINSVRPDYALSAPMSDCVCRNTASFRNPWLRSALVECSWAATTKRGCFLKDKFWRIVSKTREHKKGPALIAVAHTLLRLVYQVLNTGKPYVEHGPPPLDERQKERTIRHHVRRLGKLGIAVYSPRVAGPSAPPPHPQTLAGDAAR